jgi:hypothetical protein
MNTRKYRRSRGKLDRKSHIRHRRKSHRRHHRRYSKKLVGGDENPLTKVQNALADAGSAVTDTIIEHPLSEKVLKSVGHAKNAVEALGPTAVEKSRDADKHVTKIATKITSLKKNHDSNRNKDAKEMNKLTQTYHKAKQSASSLKTAAQAHLAKARVVKAPAKAPVVKAPVVKAPVVKAPVVKAHVVKAPVVKAPAKAPVIKAPIKAPAKAPANAHIMNAPLAKARPNAPPKAPHQM